MRRAVRYGSLAITFNIAVSVFGGTTSVMDRWDRSIYHRPPPMLSGGGGLVSTMADYLRFVQMLEQMQSQSKAMFGAFPFPGGAPTDNK